MMPRKTDVYYRYAIPNVITVQIDTREKCPLLFPAMVRIGHPELTYQSIPIAVKIESVALPFGDYRLAEYPDMCVVERKGSQLEIFKNLTESHDRIRQAKAFRKLMSGCKFPYILVEASPAELLTNSAQVTNPEVLCNRLALAIAKYGLRPIFLPWKSRNPDTRRKAGTLLIHLMLGHALSATFDVPPVLLDDPAGEQTHEEKEKVTK
jgi:hypothetical protein